MSRSYYHPSVGDLDLAEVLRALADPIRLRIVELLLEGGETTCAPLAVEVGIADSTLSHHLRQMREAGITRTRADGVLRWTSLRTEDLENRFPGLLGWLQNALHPKPAAPAHTGAARRSSSAHRRNARPVATAR
jgi:DNA-binding transcriptional ArsR family regulator